MNTRIGILGCGWLGFPLAKKFLSLGFQVSGTTTTRPNLSILSNEGIDAHYVQIFRDGVKGDLITFLNGIDILIIDFPPDRKADRGDYEGKMEQLYEACKITHTEKMILVSSTSVYGNIQGEVTEDTEPRPKSDSARALIFSEKLFSEEPLFSCTVVRFGGLIGPDRHPVTYLSGQKDIPNGDDFVNLIHQDDCIALLVAIITENWWGKLINGVYPEHPRKKDYYTREARLRGLPEPVYKKDYAGKSGKLIKSKTLRQLGFQFSTHIDHPEL